MRSGVPFERLQFRRTNTQQPRLGDWALHGRSVSGAGCTGTPSNVADKEWLNVDWSPDLSTSINTLLASSARVACYVDGSGAFLSTPFI